LLALLLLIPRAEARCWWDGAGWRCAHAPQQVWHRHAWRHHHAWHYRAAVPVYPPVYPAYYPYAYYPTYRTFYTSCWPGYPLCL